LWSDFRVEETVPLNDYGTVIMVEASAESKIVLTNGLILTDPADPVVAPHGKTVIVGEKLSQVNVANGSPLRESNTIDCSGCLIMPGLVNAHNHGAMSLLRGLADDLPLDRWLNDYIFPAEARHAHPDFVYLGTKLSAVEMALGGTTTYVDGYFHMENAARAVSEVGIRGIIAQGILDTPAPDAPEPGAWKARVETFLADFPTDTLVRPALFCHSPYLCGPDTFRTAMELARRSDCLLFSHVAESAWEVEEIKKRYGSTPVEHLKNLGVLGERFVAVHGIHVSDPEIDLFAQSGAGLVHCPESAMKLASGAAPIEALVDHGVTVAIGTDGPASNNNLDLFEEMRSASLMSKLVTGDPEALDARTVLGMATSGGARLLGMGDRIGSLETGKLADLIVVDMDSVHLAPVYDPISHLVYSAKGSDVRDVIVNGKIVVRRRRITTVDEEDLKNRVRALAASIAGNLGLDFFSGAYMGHD